MSHILWSEIYINKHLGDYLYLLLVGTHTKDIKDGTYSELSEENIKT